MASLFAALLAGVAQLSPAAADRSQTSGPGLFTAACLNGEARLAPGAAERIEFGNLPSSLRQRLGHPVSSNVWRLNTPDRAFLYVLDYPLARGVSPKICGLASASLDIKAASEAMEMQFAGSILPGRQQAMQWLLPEEGYVATATRAAHLTVLQINWLNEEDRAAAIAQLRPVRP